MPLGLFTPPAIPKVLIPSVNRCRAGYYGSVPYYMGMLSETVVGGGGAVVALDISGPGVINALNMTMENAPGDNTVTIEIDGVSVFSDTGYLAAFKTVNFIGAFGIAPAGSYGAYDALPFNTQFKVTVTIDDSEDAYLGYRYYLT